MQPYPGKEELVMLGGIHGWEWIIILVIVIIIFGVGKLPEIGGALGRSIREFRESSKVEDETTGDESVDGSKA